MATDELTERIIGAAIEVHQILGLGLLESIYEEALCHELFLRDGIKRISNRSATEVTEDAEEMLDRDVV